MSRIALISALAGITGLAGAAVAATNSASSPTPPSVLVFDQSSSENKVSVKYLYLPENGYAAVYKSDANGRPSGTAIGYAKLPAGDHRDVKIKLTEGPKSGETLWVSLYRDADNSQNFDPGNGDVAIWSPDGKPWENQFKIQ